MGQRWDSSRVSRIADKLRSAFATEAEPQQSSRQGRFWRHPRQPALHGRTPHVDPDKVGVSYSGGGPLLLAELGVAKALVQLRVVPDVIAGVSSGAIAAAAHALDPVQGTGIDTCIEVIKGVSDKSLGLTRFQIAERFLRDRGQPISVGDNAIVADLARRVLSAQLNDPDATFSIFGRDGRCRLLVAATDITTQKPVWFPSSARIDDALVASSAIPGIFPPKAMEIDGRQYTLVDGGVANNQPLSVLALEGCGTIYACAVAYLSQNRQQQPHNALDVLLKSISVMIRQQSALEEEYVRLKLEGIGSVHHVHPDVSYPINGFNFTPQTVDRIVDAAYHATIDYMRERGLPEKTVRLETAASL